MHGHLMLAITLVCSSLALAACASSGSSENSYQKHQSDFLKSVARNGRPPVGGARANGD